MTFSAVMCDKADYRFQFAFTVILEITHEITKTELHFSTIIENMS